ncbi:MAG: SIMPL domain-containing protein [Pseudomonadota bacterium]
MRYLLLISLLLITSPASAQKEDPILTLPDGQVILNISATVREEVEQDLLVATLRYTAENRDPSVVQNEINEAMTKALDRAKKEDKVKVNTGAYNVYERTVDRTKEKKWYGQQSLTLKSKEADILLKLAGELQGMGLKMANLNYTLDPKTAVAVQDNLMEEAVRELKNRADRVAKALNKSKAEIRELNAQSSGVPRPQYYARSSMMAMSADAEMAAPVAAAGEDTITLTVSGRAIIKP